MNFNIKSYGHVSNLDLLLEALSRFSLDRPSIREQVPNQRHTRSLVGLYNILDGVPGFGDAEVFEAFYPLLGDISEGLKREYGYTHLEYRSLMLVKLLANMEIEDHIDEAGIYKYSHRVHVPLITNEECMFFVGRSEYNMTPGEIVEINNCVLHNVKNGPEDRIHLIVDVVGIEEGYRLSAVENPVPIQFYLG